MNKMATIPLERHKKKKNNDRNLFLVIWRMDIPVPENGGSLKIKVEDISIYKWGIGTAEMADVHSNHHPGQKRANLIFT